MNEYYTGFVMGVFATLATPPLILAAGWSVYWTVDKLRTRKKVRDVIRESRRWCDEGLHPSEGAR